MISQFIMAHHTHPAQIFITTVCEIIISTRFFGIRALIYIFLSIRTLFAT